jgi:metal-responsive CopG/Arc/MetJ family transcriptional regulator
MQVLIELDENLVAEIDAIAKDFNKDRLQYINDTLQMSLRRNRPKPKLTEEEVSKMYADAYGKHPVQPDEFEIDEDQLIEAWKDL